jgi:hypothetical protein
VLWAYTSPELYERLVLRQAWSLERYGQFVSDGIIAALLPLGGASLRILSSIVLEDSR